MIKIHPMSGRPPELIWPVRAGGSTGNVGSFGYTRDGGLKQHKGIDWLPRIELHQIHAAHDGLITRAGFEQDNQGIQVNQGYGSRIVLQGREGIETRYGHLLIQVYPQGMIVKAGEVLALLGRTGNVGPMCEDKIETHLHFEVRQNGIAVNPEWWLHGSAFEKFGIPQTV